MTTKPVTGKTRSRTPAKTVATTPAQEKGRGGVRVPGIGVRLSIPEVRIPESARHTVRKAQAMLPPPEQAAFYVGLGVLTALQLIEWPVAVVIGAGMAVSQRTRPHPKSSEA
jgi:hypothetical protein